ncbi:unnamed protein product [Linum trigynum]|uniref:DDE Tnp4 domain-containing protein n=1 Tax=Linum trigynum TaxID=586398 RepID=A0AAV2F656_9ROSI
MDRRMFRKLCQLLVSEGGLKRYDDVAMERWVLRAILRLHPPLLRRPEAIPENCNDDKWKHFKGCLGALDGTHVKLRVRVEDKPRYQDCEGHISMKVFGVCNPNLEFTYCLAALRNESTTWWMSEQGVDKFERDYKDKEPDQHPSSVVEEIDLVSEISRAQLWSQFRDSKAIDMWENINSRNI